MVKFEWTISPFKGDSNLEIRTIEGFQPIDGGVCAAKGFKAAGIFCGINPAKTKRDLALIVAEKECDTAAVYTTNVIKAAPIYVTQKHLEKGKCKAVIVNSVCANVCMPDSMENAVKMCELTAKALQLDINHVAVASTGVIGQSLNIYAIEQGIPKLIEELAEDGNKNALEAIMTTDTVEKEIAAEFTLGGKVCRIGGMLKGSGMIHPNMATTLSFITTDVNINSKMLHELLTEVINDTLNCVSVDGDTSTNDMCLVMASGLAGNERIKGKSTDDYNIMRDALYFVLMNLARKMARDGEGATHLIECIVIGTENEYDAKTLAKSVITSSLLKAAIFGKDANWGRILCALGYSGVPFQPQDVEISIISSAGRIEVCKGGYGTGLDEELALKILSEEEIVIAVKIGEGLGSAVAWGCDLTYDYVKINGDYRS
jgi:glutamate N-acetyltransferase/amino-acid N-acetyltransferase